MKKFTLLFLFLPIQAHALAISGENPSYDILVDLNVYRAQHHLAPVEKNDELCSLARTRVAQIKTDWSHGQFQSELDKIPNMGGTFYENLARTLKPQDVVWGWSTSQMGHREAMLIPEMKFGCVAQSGNHYSFEGYIPN